MSAIKDDFQEGELSYTRLFWFCISLASFVMGYALGEKAGESNTKTEVERLCKPGPGEVAHYTGEGECSITHKGRLVTRVQL